MYMYDEDPEMVSVNRLLNLLFRKGCGKIDRLMQHTRSPSRVRNNSFLLISPMAVIDIFILSGLENLLVLQNLPPDTSAVLSS